MSVLAILEHQSGKLHRMAWETFAAAQHISAELGLELEVAIAGSGIASLAAEAGAKKAAKVHSIEHELLANYTADGYAAAYEALIRKLNPSLVLLPHTYQTRDFAPKLATRFERVLISDVIAARVESGQPVFVRQFFQGKLNGEVRPVAAAPNFASMQAGAWR